MNRSFFLVLLAAFFIPSADGSNQLLYDNGSPNLVDGFALTHWKEANSFTLNAASILQNIKFWDIEFASDFQSTVFWEIRSNAANNTPGGVLFSGTSTNLTHVATGRHDSPAPYPEYVITFDIGSVSLPVGTYWLVLHNGPLSYTASLSTDNIVWETATTSRSDPSFSDEAPFNNNWESNAANGPSQMAFQLNGVPESYRPRVTVLGFNNMGAPQISFTTISGQHYRVDYKNNLSDSTWNPVSGATNVSGTGNAVQVTDSDPNARSMMHRFYRVVLL
ncbi:MAG: hypothetical protein QOH39_1973 [Verrucomicrobiota bacterium]|jgi:hypothetical protein